MSETFSQEFIRLVAKSREVAIDLGYNYISTIHFFIADCEIRDNDSIFHFSFKNETEFEKFKKECSLQKEDLLNFSDVSLPLTKEAESAVIMMEAERKLHQQNLSYPAHFLLAALKNKESLLYGCVKKDENIYERLTNFYAGLNAFEKSSSSLKEITKQHETSGTNSNSWIKKKILEFFQRKI